MKNFRIFYFRIKDSKKIEKSTNCNEERRKKEAKCFFVFLFKSLIRVSFYAIEREKEKKKNVGRDTKGNSPFVCGVKADWRAYRCLPVWATVSNPSPIFSFICLL